jgi:Tfp pilus assembly protein PilV
MKNQRIGQRARRQQWGVSLIEALVALVVVAVGMLALAQVQVQLRMNADLSRQRAEAVRIAQQDMENWRAFSRLTSFGGKVAYADIVAQPTPTVVPSQENVNTSYFLTRLVTTNVSPGYKIMKVQVTWVGRTGATASGDVCTSVDPYCVTVDSLISQTDPTLAAQLAIPPSGTPIRNPLNRNVRIPAAAIDLGGNKSGITPPGASGVFYVFSNADASVIERCNTDVATQSDYTTAKANGLCDDLSGYLVSGFVNFDLRNNVSAVSPGTSTCEFYQDLQAGGLVTTTAPTLNIANLTLDRSSVTSASVTPPQEYVVNVVSVTTGSALVNGQSGVSVSANLEVSLSSAGTGKVNNADSASFGSLSAITLRVKGGSNVETFTPTSVGSQAVARSADGASYSALTIASEIAKLTIDPTTTLSADTVYELVIPAGVVKMARGGNNDTNAAITLVFSTGSPPTLVSTSPNDGGTTATLTDNVALTFDRTVVGAIGVVTLYKADGSIFETFNVATGVGGGGGTLVFSGATVTINPYADLIAGAGYYIGVEPGAIVDSSGIRFGGISGNLTFNFTAPGSVSSGSCPATGTALAFMKARLDNLTNSLAGGALTSACYSDATTAAETSTSYTVGYFCAVYATSLNPGLAVAWSGNLYVTGPQGWLTGGSSRYKVCRYYDSNGNGIQSYFEHPDPYTDVKESVTDQNFLVIDKNRSCPSDTVNIGSQNGVVVYFSTAQIQP